MADDSPADTFGVSIGVDDDAFRFLVHVPSNLDAAWSDRDAFQQLVEQAVWERLDRDRTIRAVDRVAETGERVELGTVTLRPDGTVVDHTLAEP
ncbi:hypothetical protein [Haloplanus aerogenes]|uniref:DUF8124 domain-containing protein n=1 Tax=Haloplanus aerogenes TaxID=660522 RepID=A0A3M0CUM1_9EURY|nr:hypothetical protein [Haloplanus aerogenes]AZH26762.1 hypothetical protein DU502_15865 [Haloplanus aerogenes]RMB13008.1 hypothetical protein ATH50_3166 [Haloplanus aerogenes]